MTVSNKVKICLLTAGIVMLAGCGSDSGSKTTPTTKPTTQTTVKIFDAVANCKTKSDVPSCHFDNGVYVIKLSNKVTDEQQQRVIKRVTNMMQWAHQDVREQFAAKRIVLGLIEDEDALQTATGEFVIELNENKGTIIDGIELIYTNISGKDETLSPTTYQKMMQLYDYYIDGNTNSAAGAALSVSYEAFKTALVQTKATADREGIAYLQYDECNYGNQQLTNNRALGTPNPCMKDGSSTDDDGNDISKGKPDMVHSLAANLNPGALLGTVYEYQVEANLNTPAGELSASDSSAFVDEGNIGSNVAVGLTDQSKLFVSWANPAFLPFKQYLDTYFFVNKK
ncbi:hypothetical protein AKG98_6 [Moritella sp. JT01]|uniref:hypothetical protein n=1 Tax=Moritella sp. JT01 TaxID=756698 RepID=UPI000793E298|nr:hypothetical protein [Moritella sp. JT01]KXO13944.1 hypothetical protein AKG98_6 [Moritella sp. JT01]